VREVVFSHDGRYFATAGKDRVARIWDIGSASQVAGLEHRGATIRIGKIAFSPDDRYVATALEAVVGALDKKALVWKWHPEDLLTEARRRVTRKKLTPGEWNFYLPSIEYRETFPDKGSPK
jgi:WD40 repeat protein